MFYNDDNDNVVGKIFSVLFLGAMFWSTHEAGRAQGQQEIKDDLRDQEIQRLRTECDRLKRKVG